MYFPSILRRNWAERDLGSRDSSSGPVWNPPPHTRGFGLILRHRSLLYCASVLCVLVFTYCASNMADSRARGHGKPSGARRVLPTGRGPANRLKREASRVPLSGILGGFCRENNPPPHVGRGREHTRLDFILYTLARPAQKGLRDGFQPLFWWAKQLFQ